MTWPGLSSERGAASRSTALLMSPSLTMSPAPEGIRIYLAQRASVFDQHALTDHITMSPEAGEQGSLVVRDGIEGGRSSEQESDPSGLARRLRFAAKRRGEEANGAHKPGAPVRYWMTSSARASSDGGMVRPSALAVFRLITSSNFVDARRGGRRTWRL